ncbi:hypothetical protein CR513_30179, partial [Mucuna pruriens]
MKVVEQREEELLQQIAALRAASERKWSWSTLTEARTPMHTYKPSKRRCTLVFVANKVKKLEVADLFDIKQAEGESLKSYLARFNNATVRVDDPNQKFFVKAFQKGLRARLFSDALALKKPASMEEIRARAEKHVEVEEDQFEWRKSEWEPDRKDMRHLARAKEDKHLVLA